MNDIAVNEIVLYATDTMADWEYGYLVAGLAMAAEQEPDRYRFRVLSHDGEPVTTMGRLRVAVDGSLDEVRAQSIAALILPGAQTWFDGHEGVLSLAARVLEAGGVVAGICGATYGLARAGLLDERDHTSNAPDFLASSGYAGSARYVDAPTVTAEPADAGVGAGALITAPATKPVDFSAAVFRALEVFPEPVLDAWYGLYTTGERRFYDQLVGASV